MSTARARKTANKTELSPRKLITIDATGMYYKDLNRKIKALAEAGARKFELNNVYGQRYIGTNLWNTQREKISIKVNGTPGSDLGAFMDGPTVEVFGNAQDATGNTMNCGKIVIHGSAGDVLGYGMRGGEIYVRGNVGYRVGIHMKEYEDKIPTVIIGGTMQDFFGEYMAGGRIIILNKFFEDNPPIRQSFFIGTGMHGGCIFVRGKVNIEQIGAEVGIEKPSSEDMEVIEDYVNRFCNEFGLEKKKKRLMELKQFYKLYPKSLRPYGRLYAY